MVSRNRLAEVPPGLLEAMPHLARLELHGNPVAMAMTAAKAMGVGIGRGVEEQHDVRSLVGGRANGPSSTELLPPIPKAKEEDQ